MQTTAMKIIPLNIHHHHRQRTFLPLPGSATRIDSVKQWTVQTITMKIVPLNTITDKLKEDLIGKQFTEEDLIEKQITEQNLSKISFPYLHVTICNIYLVRSAKHNPNIQQK